MFHLSFFVLPTFEEQVPNITVSVGRDASLPCVVDNLGNYKVAWVRVDTQTILTIHLKTISRNPRISLAHGSHRHWFLKIKSVDESDQGWYMCVINTDPSRSSLGYLEVKDMIYEEDLTGWLGNISSNGRKLSLTRGFHVILYASLHLYFQCLL
ncbi:zwei Ig domain protein zig-8-like [Artemia franciscana]|uniref:zwei Ig domain protein zig-8-like n=1 Tax=Artemia franciscana TaxID=6661 RepID=UPI0032DA9B62